MSTRAPTAAAAIRPAAMRAEGISWKLALTHHNESAFRREDFCLESGVPASCHALGSRSCSLKELRTPVATACLRVARSRKGGGVIKLVVNSGLFRPHAGGCGLPWDAHRERLRRREMRRSFSTRSAPTAEAVGSVTRHRPLKPTSRSFGNPTPVTVFWGRSSGLQGRRDAVIRLVFRGQGPKSNERYLTY